MGLNISFEEYLSDGSRAKKLNPDEHEIAMVGIGIPERFSLNLDKMIALVSMAVSEKFGGGDPQPEDAKAFKSKYKDDIHDILKYRDLPNKIEAYKMARSSKYGSGKPSTQESELFAEKYGIDLGSVILKIADIENRFNVLKNISKATKHFETRWKEEGEEDILENWKNVDSKLDDFYQ